MRILFIGCVASSEKFLEKVFGLGQEIIGVVTKEKSSFNADFVDLSIFCKKHHLNYFYAHNINDKECVEYIQHKNPDVIFCFGWSQLLGQEILKIPPLGAIGFHPADLPKNRGRHPLIWALALGLEETASTFFQMDETADTGMIVSKQKIPVTYEDDAQSLYDKVLSAGCMQLEEVVDNLKSPHPHMTVQNADEGNVWRKRSKNDGVIHWNMSCRTIYNLVRALTKPYVGAHFEYMDSEYKVWKVKEVITDQYKNIEYGKIISVFSDTHFTVKAADGFIEVLNCEPIKLQAGDYL